MGLHQRIDRQSYHCYRLRCCSSLALLRFPYKLISGAGTNDGHIGSIDLYRFFSGFYLGICRIILYCYFRYFLYIVYFRNTDTLLLLRLPAFRRRHIYRYRNSTNGCGHLRYDCVLDSRPDVKAAAMVKPFIPVTGLPLNKKSVFSPLVELLK